MYWLNSLRLKNYCGIRDADFQFTPGERQFSVFFGPNGTGKSTVMGAARIVLTPRILKGRDNSMLFRKLTYNPDYDPTMAAYSPSSDPCSIDAEFITEDGSIANVVIDGGELTVNDLAESPPGWDGWSVYCDADHPINLNRFQLPADVSDKFLHIASQVYGLPCSVGKLITTAESGEKVDIYQDFCIQKGSTRVHHKRMSDGEKKIATLLRHLCTRIPETGISIALVDNIEMHVYFRRHPRLVASLSQIFPYTQFLCTTHSESILSSVSSRWGSSSLFDMQLIHPDWDEISDV
jgi:energy-coupling factor transporter ATP-binding protein EcfA2